jgi:hypothetical protein
MIQYTQSKLVLAAGAALVAIFVVGLVELIALRFEAGDIYPPYSTLRADPLGAKACYESLEGLDGVSVRRNYLPLEQMLPLMQGGDKQTLVYLGASEYFKPAPLGEKKPKDYAEVLDGFVASGGRLVVAFASDDAAEATSQPWAATGPAGPLDAAHAGATRPAMSGLMAKLGVSLSGGRKPSGEDSPAESDRTALPMAGNESLGEGVAWKSDLYFQITDKSWTTAFKQDGHPVIIERPFGKGSVVLCSDSYFISNEAMLNQRRPGLLAWLMGSAGEIVFDETHLGVVQQTGLAALARKYNMGYAALAFLIVGVLAIWRGNSSFVPRDEALVAGLSGGEVAGKGSWAAMVNLLRTAIGPGKIIETCVAEWNKAIGRSPTASQRQAIQRASQLLAGRGASREDVKVTYNELCKVVGKHGGKAETAVRK